MGNFQDLSGTEALEKMRKLIEAEDICLFTSQLGQLPLATRPMSTAQVDGYGNIWFMSVAGSEKNRDIQSDRRVQLFYANKSRSEYLSIYGEAIITMDKDKIEELWTPIAKVWFTEGKDDPRITLIRVRPLDVYYWDTKNNKIVSLIKMMGAVLTGETMDDGIQGEIHI